MSPRQNTPEALPARIFEFVRKHELLRAGDRVAAAVSGGADSVTLLRALLEIRGELGIVLSVAHFDHQLRGAESDADFDFVRSLAQEHGLELHFSEGNARARAAQKRETLEEAARELRYAFFRDLSKRAVNKIATAHTMNDQAETVLLRLIRGAGSRGLGGIYAQRDHIIRPMLEVRRAEVLEYLGSLQQKWREDISNQDVAHSRNRIRHELLPLLARDYNPNIVETLARMAEVAQGEEEYLQGEAERLLPFVSSPGKPVRGGGRAVSTAAGENSLCLLIDALRKQPLALRRRLVRAAAEKLGIPMDAVHVQSVLDLAQSNGKSSELPGGWRVKRSFRELQFERASTATAPQAYSYSLPIPGEVLVHELLGTVRVTISPADARYNSAQPEPIILPEGAQATVRNWRAGDRYQPAHSRSEKKVKELLHELNVPERERGTWPVAVANDVLLWVHGVRQRSVLVLRGKEPLTVKFEFLASAK